MAGDGREEGLGGCPRCGAGGEAVATGAEAAALSEQPQPAHLPTAPVAHPGAGRPLLAGPARELPEPRSVPLPRGQPAPPAPLRARRWRGPGPGAGRSVPGRRGSPAGVGLTSYPRNPPAGRPERRTLGPRSCSRAGPAPRLSGQVAAGRPPPPLDPPARPGAGDESGSRVGWSGRAWERSLLAVHAPPRTPGGQGRPGERLGPAGAGGAPKRSGEGQLERVGRHPHGGPAWPFPCRRAVTDGLLVPAPLSSWPRRCQPPACRRHQEVTATSRLAAGPGSDAGRRSFID